MSKFKRIGMEFLIFLKKALACVIKRYKRELESK